jgi:hypothetical protein
MLLRSASPARTAWPAAHFDRNATTPVTDLVHYLGARLGNYPDLHRVTQCNARFALPNHFDAVGCRN